MKVWCKLSSKFIRKIIQKSDQYSYYTKSGKKYYLYLVEIDNDAYILYTHVNSLLSNTLFNIGNLLEVNSNSHFTKVQDILFNSSLFNTLFNPPFAPFELDIHSYNIMDINTYAFSKAIPTGTKGCITIRLDYTKYPEYLY